MRRRSEDHEDLDSHGSCISAKDRDKEEQATMSNLLLVKKSTRNYAE